MRIKNLFIFSLGVLLFSSCYYKDEDPAIDGKDTIRYVFGSYFSPNGIYIDTEFIRNGTLTSSVVLYEDEIVFSDVTQSGNPDKFRELALSFGENGEKEFVSWQPGLNKSYGLKYIKLLAEEGSNNFVDVSEHSYVIFENYATVIYSGYTRIDPKRDRIKLNSTGSDVRWIIDRFDIEYKLNGERPLYIEIGLDNGKVFKKKFTTRG